MTANMMIHDQLYEMLLRDQRTTANKMRHKTAEMETGTANTTTTTTTSTKSIASHQQQRSANTCNAFSACRDRINQTSANVHPVSHTTESERSTNTSSFSCKNRTTNNTETIPKNIRKLHYFIIILLCISTILSKNTAMANPTNSMQDRHQSMKTNVEHKYSRPCKSSDPELYERIQGTYPAVTPESLFSFVSSISINTRIALNAAQFHIKKFLESISSKDYTFKANNTWSQRNISWMHPDEEPLNKQITETVPKEHLNMYRQGDLYKTFSNYLGQIYSRLQLATIGVDIVRTSLKEDSNNANNKKNVERRLEIFNTLYNLLNSLLCEVSLAVELFKVETIKLTEENIETIKSKAQSLDKQLRSYLVYREYINLLEYNNAIIDVFLDRMQPKDTA